MNSDSATEMGPDSPTSLVEGEDFYFEGAAIVFTSRYLLRRGYCCESGCRHCPYREAGEMKSPAIQKQRER